MDPCAGRPELIAPGTKHRGAGTILRFSASVALLEASALTAIVGRSCGRNGRTNTQPAYIATQQLTIKRNFPKTRLCSHRRPTAPSPISNCRLHVRWEREASQLVPA